MADDSGREFVYLPVGLIKADGDARQTPEELAALGESIEEFGVLQPLVANNPKDCLLIIGRGRFSAALKVGLSHVPVLFVPDLDTPLKVLKAKLHENTRRVPLPPSEIAKAEAVIGPLDRAAAAERHKDLAGRSPETVRHGAPFARGKSRDATAKHLGRGPKTVRRIVELRDAGQADPARYGHLLGLADKQGTAAAFREFERLKRVGGGLPNVGEAAAEPALETATAALAPQPEVLEPPQAAKINCPRNVDYALGALAVARRRCEAIVAAPHSAEAKEALREAARPIFAALWPEVRILGQIGELPGQPAVGAAVVEAAKPAEPPAESADGAAHEVASRLLAAIRRHTPGFKEPNLTAWARDADLMLRRDHRELAEVVALVEWVHCTDGEDPGFWRSNILSVRKLRQQFDQLVIQRRNGGRTGRRRDPTNPVAPPGKYADVPRRVRV